MSTIPAPVPYFADLGGDALDAGYIYIGESGMDAQANPVQVYWDAALSITASQPLRTIDGYSAYQGRPTPFFTGETSYSVTVLDRNGVAVMTNIEGGGAANSTGSVITSSEAIAANNFVNVYDLGGALRVRKAVANDPAKFANGFVPSAISNGASGIISFAGMNTITVASPAADVWLSDSVPGSFTTTPPSASGSIVQRLGPAIPGEGVYFTLQERVLL